MSFPIPNSCILWQSFSQIIENQSLKIHEMYGLQAHHSQHLISAYRRTTGCVREIFTSISLLLISSLTLGIVRFYLAIQVGCKGFPSSSAGEEPAYSAGDPSSIPGSWRSPGEGIGYPLQYSWASLMAQLGKETACTVGDLGLILGLERCPGEGNSNPFQYSGLENSMDCIVCRVAKSQTRLRGFYFLSVGYKDFSFPPKVYWVLILQFRL